MPQYFENPTNGYHELATDSASWLWCLLFGPIYFAVKGIWTHAVVSFILALCTFGVSHFLYPFFVYTIVEGHYRRKGWLEVV